MRYAIMGATLEQVKAVGGANIRESPRTGIIFADLTPEQVNRLKAMGCSVSEVTTVRAPVMAPPLPVVAPPPPGAAIPLYTPDVILLALGFDKLRSLTSPPLYGEGFNLAMIDSGIRKTHVAIAGRVVYEKNFTAEPMEDAFGHGTGTCSIALTVAPKCGILNLKVLDSKGEGSDESVVLALDECIALLEAKSEYAPSVINLSVGALDDGNPNNPMRVACRAALDSGIWIIAAAGNSGPYSGTITSPACERYVAAIGSAKYLASENAFVLSSFSSRGPTREGLTKPDVIMIGEDLIMASSESDNATVAKSGTSFAAPFCSGAAILFFEGYYRQAVPTEEIPGVPMHPPPGIPVPIQDVLDKWMPLVCVKPQGVAAGKDDDYGYGIPVGSLIAQVLGLVPTVAISDILSPMMSIFVLGMFGMMMVPMAKSLMK